MVNVLDYLKKSCKTEITKNAPLNELDASIFARFSYLPFSAISVSRRETMKSLAQKFKTVPKKNFIFQNDIALIQLMAESPRFANLAVTDVVVISDPSTNEQFSAATIHLPNRCLFVTYIGTDNTLHGWREDCDLVISGQIPSQISGRKYLLMIIRKNFWRKIYVGGHSKGGNVAMYSTIVLRDFYQNKIARVYSFDGPGLSKELLAQDSGKPVLQKIINYVPQDSIIGRLFSHEEKFKVVKSNAKTFWQHDIYTWEVNLDKNQFSTATISKKSDYVDQTLSAWMESATYEQKKSFVDLVFKVLKRSNISHPAQIVNSKLKSIPALLKSYRTLDKEEKKILINFLKMVLKTIGKNGQGDET